MIEIFCLFVNCIEKGTLAAVATGLKEYRIENSETRTQSCYYCTNKDDCHPDDREEKLCQESDDGCYILFDNDNQVTQMGCTSDLDEDILDDPFTYVCKTELCNGNLPKGTNCVLCDSNDDPKCALSPDDVDGLKRCNKRPLIQCYIRLQPGKI